MESILLYFSLIYLNIGLGLHTSQSQIKQTLFVNRLTILHSIIVSAEVVNFFHFCWFVNKIPWYANNNKA